MFKEVDGELVRDNEIWKKWQSGFGGIAEETVQYKDNLLQLKGIVVDYGIHDENAWILKAPTITAISSLRLEFASQ